jgi:cell division protein FtsQ
MLLRKKKTSARGASRKVVQPSRKSVSFAPMLSAMLPALMVIVVTGFVFAVYEGVNWLQAQPVERVVMTGDFTHVDEQQLTEQVKPFLKAGFVAVDLVAIREQLEKTPWIYAAQVERRWPGTLLVEITEQQAIARWGKNGLLNHRGQLFVPEKIQLNERLPLLAGPDGSEEIVMQQFGEFADVLGQKSLFLLGLYLNERGSWQAIISNDVASADVSVMLGREQMMEKMHRLVNVYQQYLKAEFTRIQRIDMRYNNGLAVAWRKIVEQQKTEKKV